ncbi:MAG: hypothetical protein AAGJ10_06890 [Bacteroidota bacterium]
MAGKSNEEQALQAFREQIRSQTRLQEKQLELQQEQLKLQHKQQDDHAAEIDASYAYAEKALAADERIQKRNLKYGFWTIVFFVVVFVGLMIYLIERDQTAIATHIITAIASVVAGYFGGKYRQQKQNG